MTDRKDTDAGNQVFQSLTIILSDYSKFDIFIRFVFCCHCEKIDFFLEAIRLSSSDRNLEQKMLLGAFIQPDTPLERTHGRLETNRSARRSMNAKNQQSTSDDDSFAACICSCYMSSSEHCFL